MIAFLTLEGTFPNEGVRVVVVPSDGGAPLYTLKVNQKVITQTPTLRFTPDGKSLAYIVNDRGVSNIWSLPLTGGALRQITDFKSDLIFDFAWSRDGKQLALSRGRTTQDVVLLRDTGK